MDDSKQIELRCGTLRVIERYTERGCALPKDFVSTAEKNRVIDDTGFRPNVGIVVMNVEGQVFWANVPKARTPAIPPGRNQRR